MAARREARRPAQAANGEAGDKWDMAARTNEFIAKLTDMSAAMPDKVRRFGWKLQSAEVAYLFNCLKCKNLCRSLIALSIFLAYRRLSSALSSWAEAQSLRTVLLSSPPC